MFETAHAKINLALHVRARRVDGYHELETLFAFTRFGDEVTVAAGEGLSLDIIGPFAAGLDNGGDNLVLRAATALRARFGIEAGANLILDKKLPIAAGIGGGSADAAAALRLLKRFWQIACDDAALFEIAAALGADVPACVASQTVRGEGVGDVLQRVEGEELSGLPILLVNPLIPCPTGPVFKAWDGVDHGPLVIGDDLTAGRNDLQAPAISLVPEIATVLERLNATGPRLARMSGSGATCFAIYATSIERDTAAASLPEHWWSVATDLL